jgi:hypothetical protein
MKHDGTFTHVRTVTFAKKVGQYLPAFAGTATIYAFEPADPKKTKVRYAAVVEGVQHNTMCVASGDVEKAILKAAQMERTARGALAVTAEYDTYPDPVGCPMDKLQAKSAEQVVLFYAR